MNGETSKTRISQDECVAWVTLRPLQDDPLQPTWIETTVRGKTADDVWRQIAEFEQKGYAVWGLEGVNGR